MDLDVLVNLLFMIISDGRQDNQDMIQPLVLVTSAVIHIVLLPMLTGEHRASSEGL